MAEFVPYPMMPPAPAHEFRKTTPGMEYNVLTPEQRGNLGEQEGLQQQQIALTDDERKLRDQQKAIEAETAAQQAAEAQRIAEERAQRDQETANDLGSWKNRLEGAYKDAQSAKSPALFADRTTGQSVLQGLGLALAGIGDTLATAHAFKSGQGAPPSTFLQLVEMDLSRQRERIGQLKDNVLMARTGVQDAQKAREIALSEVDAKGAGIMKRLEGVAKARLAQLSRSGLAGDIEQNKQIQDIRAKGIEYRRQSLAPLYQRHADPTTEAISRETPMPVGGPKSTEGENKFAMHGAAIERALATAEGLPALTGGDLKRVQDQELASEAANLESGKGGAQAMIVRGERFLGLVPRSKVQGLTPQAQQVIQANDEAVTNLAHMMTGAGMPAEEARKKAQTYLPVAGDSPEVQTQKRAAMRSAAADVMGLAGAAAAKLPQTRAPANPPPLVPPAPKQQGIPPATPSGKPESSRDRAIRMLRANPGRPGARAVMTQYNIAPEDLR